MRSIIRNHMSSDSMATLRLRTPYANVFQYNSYPVYGTYIFGSLVASVHILLARDLLSCDKRMLRGLRNSVFLCTDVSLPRARSARAETILSNSHPSGMGVADYMVQEMLWRRTRTVENT